MAEAPGDDDRLPWIESPRRGRRPAPAARRARTPLLVLLGLLLGTAIAVMAYIAGRTTAPALHRQRIAPPVSRPLSSVAQPAQRPASPAPMPQAPPRIIPSEAERGRAVPARKQVARPRIVRQAKPKAAPVRRVVRRKRDRVTIHRNPVPRSVSPAYVVPQRRTPWPSRPFAGPQGRVIQLGAYRTLPQADAAWWRLVRVYPYLGTLPRVVTWTGPTPGQARTYRVRLATGSRREARALCRNLHRIGRGCVVV